MSMRLHKYIAHCGIASRRKAEALIMEGKVEVNGKIITELGVQVDPASDKIKVEGKHLHQERMVYLALHKPRGYVTTSSDDLDRKTVLDLIEGVKERIYPVGRLDRDSEGLLILTNDGEMANYLTHPRCGVEKVYRVTVDGNVTDETLARIREGARIGGRLIIPRRLKLLHRNAASSRIEIEIGEGLNREVRRIFASMDHEARKLIRIEVGPISLEGLPRGMARKLTARELTQLKQGMVKAGFEPQMPSVATPSSSASFIPRERKPRPAAPAPRMRVKTSKRGRGGSGRGQAVTPGTAKPRARGRRA